MPSDFEKLERYTQPSGDLRCRQKIVSVAFVAALDDRFSPAVEVMFHVRLLPESDCRDDKTRLQHFYWFRVLWRPRPLGMG